MTKKQIYHMDGVILKTQEMVLKVLIIVEWEVKKYLEEK